MALMAGVAASSFPAAAGEYFLVVNVVKDINADRSHVKAVFDERIVLKGSEAEAMKVYLVGCRSREACEAELGNLQLYHFTLTHAGMSAYVLGYHLGLELAGWRQQGGKWISSMAFCDENLPLHIVMEDQELWKSEVVPLPLMRMLPELYDGTRLARDAEIFGIGLHRAIMNGNAHHEAWCRRGLEECRKKKQLVDCTLRDAEESSESYSDDDQDDEHVLPLEEE